MTENPPGGFVSRAESVGQDPWLGPSTGKAGTSLPDQSFGKTSHHYNSHAVLADRHPLEWTLRTKAYSGKEAEMELASRGVVIIAYP